MGRHVRVTFCALFSVSLLDCYVMLSSPRAHVHSAACIVRPRQPWIGDLSPSAKHPPPATKETCCGEGIQSRIKLLSRDRQIFHSAREQIVGRANADEWRATRLNLPFLRFRCIAFSLQEGRGFATLAIRATVAPSTPLVMEDRRPTWMCSDSNISHIDTRLALSGSEVFSLQARVSEMKCATYFGPMAEVEPTEHLHGSIYSHVCGNTLLIC
jgi:hypothetical protein